MSDLFDRLEGARSSLAFKAPCRVATTANIILSGEQTIDGVAVLEEGANDRPDRVLVKNQTDQRQNGIYIVSTGIWRRAKDFDGNTDVVDGTRVYVHSGSVGVGEYTVTSDDPIIIDTSNIVFEVAASNLATEASEAAQAAAEAAQAAAEQAETNAETAETNALAAQSAAEAAQGAAEDAQTAAETAETNAETAETNAETAASTATTQAGIATTQAGIATTQAGNAATSAMNAATAETNAETAETNAEAAQAAAEAARDAAIAASENPALTYLFDNGTADADPGAGEFRFNNGTLASVTTVFLDNSDDDGNTVSGFIDAFDDTGDTSARGYLLIKGIDTPATFFVGLVTGSVVDGTGYRKVSVTHVASGGTFTATERFSVLFGPAGPGGGDVSGPASAVDGNLASFDETTGKLIQDSGIAAANVVVDADIANMLETDDIGVSVQAYDAQLDEWSGVDPSEDGKSLVAAANYAAMFGSLKQAATEDATGVVEWATTAEVRAASASSDQVIRARSINEASALVTLTDAATVAVDWTAGINFTLTITANRTLGNPTNEIPGTFRTVFVISDGGPDELTFGSEYGGTPPTLDDITTTKGYLLSIYCRAAGQFLVSSIDGSPA